jgi:hypothetical protein
MSSEKGFLFYVYDGVILPRKARIINAIYEPVPETDTGRLVENTKGREITLSKELGKIIP